MAMTDPVKSEEACGVDESFGLRSQSSSEKKIHYHRATETEFDQMSGSTTREAKKPKRS